MKTGERIPLCNRDSSPIELYGLMFGIRTFEQSLLDLFQRGVLAGTTHTCLGQEATAVGVFSALDLGLDCAFSNHRGHGHFLAYCGEPELLYLEVMGKPGGVCGGRGGSQHLQHRNLYSNGIQGGIVPVATGIALAEKLKGSGAVSVVFLGDGTLGEGAVYESFNIASLWQLPTLFVIENNGFAQSTPCALEVAGSIRARPEAFGIPTTEIRSTNVETIRNETSHCVDAMRDGAGPRALVLHNYRLGPHSKGDDNRDPAEIRAAWDQEPLKVLRERLDTTEVQLVEAAVTERIGTARERALAAPRYEY